MTHPHATYDGSPPLPVSLCQRTSHACAAVMQRQTRWLRGSLQGGATRQRPRARAPRPCTAVMHRICRGSMTQRLACMYGHRHITVLGAACMPPGCCASVPPAALRWHASRRSSVGASRGCAQLTLRCTGMMAVTNGSAAAVPGAGSPPSHLPSPLLVLTPAANR